MTTPIIVANWKMQLGVRESVALARAVLRHVRQMEAPPQMVLVPSTIALPEVVRAVARSRVQVAAPHVASVERGALTGQTSIQSVKEVGARAVLVGHSETRQWMHDSVADLAATVALADVQGLLPILCVGETAAQRRAGETLAVLHDQVMSVIGNKPRRMPMWVAYEPIWAIGTGETPSIHDVAEAHAHIRAMVEAQGGAAVSVLYGGSVTPDNIYEFLHHEDVDGVLVGAASTTVHSLLDLIHVTTEL